MKHICVSAAAGRRAAVITPPTFMLTADQRGRPPRPAPPRLCWGGERGVSGERRVCSLITLMVPDNAQQHRAVRPPPWTPVPLKFQGSSWKLMSGLRHRRDYNPVMRRLIWRIWSLARFPNSQLVYRHAGAAFFFSVFPFRNPNRRFIRSEAQIVGVTRVEEPEASRRCFFFHGARWRDVRGYWNISRRKRLGRYLCVSSPQRRPRWKTRIHHRQGGRTQRSLPEACQTDVTSDESSKC